MLLSHEFPFHVPVEQQDQPPTDIIDQLYTLAWKTQANRAQFGQASRVLAREEEKGKRFEEAIQRNLIRQKIDRLKQTFDEIERSFATGSSSNPSVDSKMKNGAPDQRS